MQGSKWFSLLLCSSLTHPNSVPLQSCRQLTKTVWAWKFNSFHIFQMDEVEGNTSRPILGQWRRKLIPLPCKYSSNSVLTHKLFSVFCFILSNDNDNDEKEKIMYNCAIFLSKLTNNYFINFRQRCIEILLLVLGVSEILTFASNEPNASQQEWCKFE